MNLKGYVSRKGKMRAEIAPRSQPVNGGLSIPSGMLNKDYNELINKPQIEGVELIENKTFEDLGMVEASAQDILDIFMEE